MNKFKLYMLGLGLASMGLASCTAGFLDVESKTESTTDNFYRTESDAWRALIGCYDGWQCTSSSAGCAFYFASEVMADECLPVWEIQMPVIIRCSTVLMSISRLRI